MSLIPFYNSFVAKSLREGFQGVDNHDYDTLAVRFAPNIHHRFAGNHSLGGERNDSQTVVAWLQRVGRVLPDLAFDLRDIHVAGGPNDSTVTVRWDARATLKDGSQPYRNRGVHIVRLRRGKIIDMDVYQDTQVLIDALRRQHDAGISEAHAAPITS